MPVRDRSQAILLEAATELLCREAVRGLQDVLAAQALQRATLDFDDHQGVSRHTVYRLWPRRSDAIIDVAKHAADLRFGLTEDGYKAASRLYETVVEDPDLNEMTEADKRARFRDVLSATFESQFTLVRIPTGWALHAAALTSSPLWQGPRPDEELMATGRQILASRAALYVVATERWVSLFRGVLAIFRRRPRSGFTPETIITLMHCMFEGCVLRFYVDPELNDPDIDDAERERRLRQAADLASDAMVELAWAYTEPGSLRDPRRPEETGSSASYRHFDAVVHAAMDLYAGEGSAVVEVDEAADQAGVANDVAALFFHDSVDLADSVVRRLLAAVGLEFSESGIHDPAPMLRSVLRRVSAVTTSHPRAITAAQAYRSSQPDGATPFFDELTDAIVDALRSPHLHCPSPIDTARTLIELALRGETGRMAVEAMLKLMAKQSAANIDPEQPAMDRQGQ